MNILEIRELDVEVEHRPILEDFSLSIPSGKIHVLMGKNGAGKSTLANIIAGHPDFQVTGGEVLFDGHSILHMSPDARARAGIFLSFQQPIELPGVSVANFIREALQARSDIKLSAVEFYNQLYGYMDFLKLDRSITSRSMNVGFSGGERKRLEILQMLMLKPKFIILDEIDSGVDVDALKLIANGINKVRDDTLSILIITHYRRLLDYVVPDAVHIMNHGKIVKSGGLELVEQIEQTGYDDIR